jgi:hypothetical protein
MMRAMLTFGAIAAAMIGVAALALSGVFRETPGAARALEVAAVVAWGTQVVAFAAVWRLRQGGVQFMGAWGVGAVIRFVAVVLFALFGIKELAPAPALIGIVTFFFLTTLAEPWLFRTFARPAASSS